MALVGCTAALYLSISPLRRHLSIQTLCSYARQMLQQQQQSLLFLPDSVTTRVSLREVFCKAAHGTQSCHTYIGRSDELSSRLELLACEDQTNTLLIESCPDVSDMLDQYYLLLRGYSLIPLRQLSESQTHRVAEKFDILTSGL